MVLVEAVERIPHLSAMLVEKVVVVMVVMEVVMEVMLVELVVGVEEVIQTHTTAELVVLE